MASTAPKTTDEYLVDDGNFELFSNISRLLKNASIKDSEKINANETEASAFFSDILHKYFNSTVDNSDLIALREFCRDYNTAVFEAIKEDPYTWLLEHNSTEESSFFTSMTRKLKEGFKKDFQSIDKVIKERYENLIGEKYEGFQFERWLGIGDEITLPQETSSDDRNIEQLIAYYLGSKNVPEYDSDGNIDKGSQVTIESLTPKDEIFYVASASASGETFKNYATNENRVYAFPRGEYVSGTKLYRNNDGVEIPMTVFSISGENVKTKDVEIFEYFNFLNTATTILKTPGSSGEQIIVKTITDGEVSYKKIDEGADISKAVYVFSPRIPLYQNVVEGDSVYRRLDEGGFFEFIVCLAFREYMRKIPKKALEGDTEEDLVEFLNPENIEKSGFDNLFDKLQDSSSMLVSPIDKLNPYDSDQIWEGVYLDTFENTSLIDIVTNEPKKEIRNRYLVETGRIEPFRDKNGEFYVTEISSGFDKVLSDEKVRVSNLLPKSEADRPAIRTVRTFLATAARSLYPAVYFPKTRLNTADITEKTDSGDMILPSLDYIEHFLSALIPKALRIHNASEKNPTVTYIYRKNPDGQGDPIYSLDTIREYKSESKANPNSEKIIHSTLDTFLSVHLPSQLIFQYLRFGGERDSEKTISKYSSSGTEYQWTIKNENLVILDFMNLAVGDVNTTGERFIDLFTKDLTLLNNLSGGGSNTTGSKTSSFASNDLQFSSNYENGIIQKNMSFNYTVIYKELNPILREAIQANITDKLFFIYASGELGGNALRTIFPDESGTDLSIISDIQTVLRSISPEICERYIFDTDIVGSISENRTGLLRGIHGNAYWAREASESSLIAYYAGDTVLSDGYGLLSNEKGEIESFLDIYQTTRDYYYKVLLNKAFVNEDEYKLYEKTFIGFTALVRFISSKIDNIHNIDYFDKTDVYNFLESYGLSELNDIGVFSNKDAYNRKVVRHFNEIVRSKGSKESIEKLIALFGSSSGSSLEVKKGVLIEKVDDFDSITMNNTNNGGTGQSNLLYAEDDELNYYAKESGSLTKYSEPTFDNVEQSRYSLVDVDYTTTNETRDIKKFLPSSSSYADAVASDEYWDSDNVTEEDLHEFGVTNETTKYLSTSLIANIAERYTKSRFLLSAMDYLERHGKIEVDGTDDLLENTQNFPDTDFIVDRFDADYNADGFPDIVTSYFKKALEKAGDDPFLDKTSSLQVEYEDDEGTHTYSLRDAYRLVKLLYQEIELIQLQKTRKIDGSENNVIFTPFIFKTEESETGGAVDDSFAADESIIASFSGDSYGHYIKKIVPEYNAVDEDNFQIFFSEDELEKYCWVMDETEESSNGNKTRVEVFNDISYYTLDYSKTFIDILTRETHDLKVYKKKDNTPKPIPGLLIKDGDLVINGDERSYKESDLASYDSAPEFMCIIKKLEFHGIKGGLETILIEDTGEEMRRVDLLKKALADLFSGKYSTSDTSDNVDLSSKIEDLFTWKQNPVNAQEKNDSIRYTPMIPAASAGNLSDLNYYENFKSAQTKKVTAEQIEQILASDQNVSNQSNQVLSSGSLIADILEYLNPLLINKSEALDAYITEMNDFSKITSENPFMPTHLYSFILYKLLYFPNKYYNELFESSNPSRYFFDKKVITFLNEVIKLFYTTSNDPLIPDFGSLLLSSDGILEVGLKDIGYIRDADGEEVLGRSNVQAVQKKIFKITECLNNALNKTNDLTTGNLLSTISTRLIVLLDTLSELFQDENFAAITFTLSEDQARELDYLQAIVKIFLSYTSSLRQIELKNVYDTRNETAIIFDSLGHETSEGFKNATTFEQIKMDAIPYDELFKINETKGGTANE